MSSDSHITEAVALLWSLVVFQILFSIVIVKLICHPLMNTRKKSKQAKFDTEHVIELQKFEWLLVYHHKGLLPRATPTTWTSAYDSTGFARAERRLFGKANYTYYFGPAQGLSGFHKITNLSIPAPTDFQLHDSVQESYYDPHIYLLR